MPLIAHNNLPSFERLRDAGHPVLYQDQADNQDIRELHVGLLNMMPDAALAATERQFLRLIGESNDIVQFYVHIFSVDGLERSEGAQSYIDQYYETFEQIKKDGLDALIITGANVAGSELQNQVFWKPLMEVVEWAKEHVTSVLCSCLATHAVVEGVFGQKRELQEEKVWGVYPHNLVDRKHPLAHGINTCFDVPHSRWNAISREQFEEAGLCVLAESDEGIHLATSGDGLRFVFFQGHPEYDTISLMKEYKREVLRFENGELDRPPPFPAHYFSPQQKAIFKEYLLMRGEKELNFPEKLVAPMLDNTWRDSAQALVGNWLGLVYLVTNVERSIPFMEGIDPDNPLGLKD